MQGKIMYCLKDNIWEMVSHKVNFPGGWVEKRYRSRIKAFEVGLFLAQLIFAHAHAHTLIRSNRRCWAS